MADVPVSIVVAAFSDEAGATQALQDLKTARDADLIKLKDAVVLKKDDSGDLKIHETIDKGMPRGAVIGGVAGAVVGVIAGPIGWLTLGGAAVGALAVRLREHGFADKRMHELGERLPPGSSAIVAVVEHEWVRQVEERLRMAASDLITEAIEMDLADQLDEEAERQQTSGGQSRAA